MHAAYAALLRGALTAALCLPRSSSTLARCASTFFLAASCQRLTDRGSQGGGCCSSL